MDRQPVLALVLALLIGAACSIDTEGAAPGGSGSAGSGGISGVAGGGGFPLGGAGGSGALPGGGSGGSSGSSASGGDGGVSGSGDGGGLDAGDASDASNDTPDFVDAGPLAPKDISGLVLWLRSDVGVTTVDAAVAAPSALSDAAWTKSGCSATAMTLTESIDVTPRAHLAYQLVPNLQLGHSAHFSVGIPAASGGGRYPAVVPNGGAGAVFLDAQAGTIISAVGVSSPTYSNGVLEFDITVTSKHLGLYVTPDGATLTYLGNGSHTATFTNITVTQRSVSSWADQSGSGHDAVQAADGKRPLFVPQGLAGLPSLVGNGSSDNLVTDAIDLSTAAGTTWFVVLFDATSAHQVPLEHGSTSTASGALLEVNAGAPGRLASGLRGATSLTKTLASNADTFGLGTGSLLIGVNDPSLPASSEMQLWLNGVDISGASDGVESSGGFGNAPMTVFGRGGGAFAYSGLISEIGLYSRALTSTERAGLTAWLGNRYGVAGK